MSAKRWNRGVTGVLHLETRSDELSGEAWRVGKKWAADGTVRMPIKHYDSMAAAKRAVERWLAARPPRRRRP